MGTKAFFFLVISLLGFAVLPNDLKAQLKAGAAVADTTPVKFPVNVNGGMRNRLADSASDPLQARAIVLESGGSSVALCIVDLCMIPDDVVHSARKLASEATGIKEDSILIAATHTHTAPAAAPVFQSERQENYIPHLTNQIAKAIIDAHGNLELAELGFGSHDEPNHVFNRRWLVADGESYVNPFGDDGDRAWMNPGFENKKVTRPAGPVDPDVSILAIRSTGGRPIAVFANYSLHYVGNVPALSGDYFGAYAEIAEDALFPDIDKTKEPDGSPPFVAILSNGTSADVNNVNFSLPRALRKPPYEQAQLVARDVAIASAKAWKKVEFSSRLPISTRSETLTLGVRKADEKELERARELLKAPPPEGGYLRREEIYARESVLLDEYPDKVEVETQAIRIGDISIAAAPCEIFTAIGLELKERSPFAHHFTVSLANGYHGYLPTPEEHELGGYETWRARSSYLEAGASPKIIDSLLKQFGELLDGGSGPEDGKPRPLSPEESRRSIHVPEGYRVELVVAEPEIMDPVAIDWDTRGRLWVVEMGDYPSGLDGNGKPGGRVRVLEDRDGDGKYEKNSVFLDGLSYPKGIKTWRGGVLITAAPDVIYAEDSDADGKADIVETWFGGFAEGNQQLRVNGLRWSVDGWLHLANGKSGGVIFSPAKPDSKVDIRNYDCRVLPDSRTIEATTGRTQFGVAFDAFGQRFGCDNSFLAWHVVLEERFLKRNPHVSYPPAINQLVPERNPPVYPKSRLRKRIHADYMANKFTSACGLSIYRDEFLELPGTAPVENQVAFICEPVHNVVAALTLKRHGLTYRAERSFPASEFIAAEDAWFRPVMTRTGPDGALWVVDMYRDIVEHPQWVPKEIRETWEKNADLRAGHTMGRIYRVVKSGNPLRPFPEIDETDDDSLIALLGHPNGTVRDMAQQALMWNRSDASVAGLRGVLAQPDTGAEYQRRALAALGCLSQEITVEDLNNAAKIPELLPLAFQLTENLPEGVPFPSALAEILSSGGVPLDHCIADAFIAVGSERWAPHNADLLAKMASLPTGDRSTEAYVIAAFSTGLPNYLESVATALAEAKTPAPGFVAAVLTTAAKMGKSELVAPLSKRLTTANTKGNFEPWQIAAAAGFANSLPDSESLTASARKIAEDPDAPESLRSQAIAIVGANGGKSEGDFLAAILTDAKPGQQVVISAALDALSRLSDPSVAESITAIWGSLTPDVRTKAVGVLLRRTAWTEHLLDSIDSGLIAPSEIASSARKRLNAHKDSGIKTRAAKLFARPDTDRTAVVTAHRDVLSMKGDAEKGKALFALHCAVCHKLDGVGNAIGPDLRSITDRSPIGLLTSILDPTAQMEPIYQGYVCETESGEHLSGLIVGESGGGIEIVGMDARHHNIPGAAIRSLKGTGRSFMPDGFETALSKQELADLIRYLGYPGARN